MPNRRHFIKYSGLASVIAGIPFSKLSSKEKLLWQSFPDFNENKNLWQWAREAYVTSSKANLNNGAVSPQPKVVQDVFNHYYREFNEIPSMHMWSKTDIIQAIKQKLAVLAGCSADELAINRNTTEAINTVIWGLDHKPGDEVIVCEQDYPTVMNSWEEKEARFGIVLKWISFDLPIEDENLIIETYSAQVTNKTKAVMITHMNNINGNIMPVKAIATAVKKINPNIKVIVDGAHAFAHIDFKISDLGCDFYGTSLHKWLCAPFGTGLLYVNKKEIRDLWPLFTNLDPKKDDMSKFQTVGTNMLPAQLAIARAIDFHNTIGIERKESRLRYLKDYWMTRVADIPNVEIKTSFKPEFACALGSFYLKNMAVGETISRLYKDYHIHVGSKADKHKKFEGIRVTPHVYTHTDELDRLVKGIRDLSKM